MGITLLRPIKVKVQFDTNGWWLVSSKKFLVYGVGKTPGKAMGDFMEVLEETYGLIAKGAAKGNTYDQQQVEYMQEFMDVTSSGWQGRG
jgi:hypothetical protein